MKYLLLCMVIFMIFNITGEEKTNNDLWSLSEIRSISSKGRIQDVEYNSNLKWLVEKIDKNPLQSLEFLIENLRSKKVLDDSIVNYWKNPQERFVALLILTNVFTDSTGLMNVPCDYSWDVSIKRKNSNVSANTLLHSLSEKDWDRIHAKWNNLYGKNKEKIIWDGKGKFFKIKGLPSQMCSF